MPAHKMPREIDNRIIELRKEWLVQSKIQEQLFAEFNRRVSSWYIWQICKALKDAWDRIDKWLEELNAAVEEKEPYEVANGFYIFYKDNTPYPIAVKTVDNIFKDYSKHWTNMTGQQVMIKYKLKPIVWNMIKGRLSLYKDSNIISPYTLENLTEEEAEKYIEEWVDEAIQDKFIRVFERKSKNKYKSEFTKYSNYYHNAQQKLDDLLNVLKTYDPIKLEDFELANRPEVDNNDTIEVAFADLHIWKSWTDWIVSRMYKMTQELIARPEKNINLIFLWDLWETFLEWWMHPWQTEHMEWIYWIDLMKLVVWCLEKMLKDLFLAGKNVVFYGKPWNHDRMGKTHDDDRNRTAALVIYEWLKLAVQHIDVRVEALREHISTLYLDNFNIVCMHWEWADSKKAMTNPEKFLWNHIQKNKHKETIILFGDKHHVNIDEKKNVTVIGVPAMAWQGEYDKRLDLHSKPWYIIIERNSDWDADIIIKRVK